MSKISIPKIRHRKRHTKALIQFSKLQNWSSNPVPRKYAVSLDAFLTSKELNRGFGTPRESSCCPGCCCEVL